MPLPPKPELKAWILDWLDEKHPECPSGVDVIVGLLEDLGYFFEERGATEDEYLRMVALCLTAFLDDLTPDTTQEILGRCEQGLGVTITRTN